MENTFTLQKLIEFESCLCVGAFGDTLILGFPSHLTVLSNQTSHSIPWVSSPPIQICIESSSCAVLTRNHIFLIPLSSLGSECLPMWRRFVEKDYLNLTSRPPDSLLEEVVETIGGCLAGRERSIDNSLDVSLIETKDTPCGVYFWREYLLVFFKKGCLVVNFRNLGLQSKVQFNSEVQTVQVLEEVVLLKGRSLSVLYTRDLLESREVSLTELELQNATLQYFGCQVVLATLNPGRVDLFKLENCSFPFKSFELPNSSYQKLCVWKSFLVLFREKKLEVFPQISNKNLSFPSKPKPLAKVCVCNSCQRKQSLPSMNYSSWLNWNNLLWEHNCSFRCTELLSNSLNLIVVGHDSVHELSIQETQSTQEVLEAVENCDIVTIN